MILLKAGLGRVPTFKDLSIWERTGTGLGREWEALLVLRSLVASWAGSHCRFPRCWCGRTSVHRGRRWPVFVDTQHQCVGCRYYTYMSYNERSKRLFQEPQTISSALHGAKAIRVMLNYAQGRISPWRPLPIIQKRWNISIRNLLYYLIKRIYEKMVL